MSEETEYWAETMPGCPKIKETTWKNKVSWGCNGTYFLTKVGCEWGEAGMQTLKKTGGGRQ